MGDLLVEDGGKALEEDGISDLLEEGDASVDAGILAEDGSPVLLEDGTHLLEEGAAATPLLVTAALRSVAILPPSPSSPWTIDPERTQELPPAYGT